MERLDERRAFGAVGTLARRAARLCVVTSKFALLFDLHPRGTALARLGSAGPAGGPLREEEDQNSPITNFKDLGTAGGTALRGPRGPGPTACAAL